MRTLTKRLKPIQRLQETSAVISISSAFLTAHRYNVVLMRVAVGFTNTAKVSRACTWRGTTHIKAALQSSTGQKEAQSDTITVKVMHAQQEISPYMRLRTSTSKIDHPVTPQKRPLALNLAGIPTVSKHLQSLQRRQQRDSLFKIVQF